MENALSTAQDVFGLHEQLTDCILPIISTLQVSVADCLADVGGAPEVDHFNSIGLSRRLHQHYVLRFQIGVNQTQLL